MSRSLLTQKRPLYLLRYTLFFIKKNSPTESRGLFLYISEVWVESRLVVLLRHYFEP